MALLKKRCLTVIFSFLELKISLRGDAHGKV